MSMNTGQSLIPYPWAERKKFNDRRRLIQPVVKLTRLLANIGSIISPPAYIAWAWMRFGFRRYNDSWARRPLVIFALAVIAIFAFGLNPMVWVHAWNDVLVSLGPKSKLEPLRALVTAVLAGLPYALLLQSLHGLTRTYQIEYTTNAFPKPVRPTFRMRMRSRSNTRKLRTGIDKKSGGYVRFGVIAGDRLPWRTSRHGMVVERKIEKMGHGMFIGSNGMGKTTVAETFTHYILANDSTMVYLDFKASIDTRNGLSAVAKQNDKPYEIFDIGLGSTDTTWYDVFDWDGSPADKAGVLLDCFELASGGGSDHYRNIALSWMPMQFEALERLGLNDGEGVFDFLRETSIPANLDKRIAPLRSSEDDRTRELFETWNEEIARTKASDLTGLRSELTKIVNSAGSRLRPNESNPDPISLRETMNKGGLVYFGITEATDKVIVKVLGSLIFKDLGIIVAERSRMANKGALRDVFVIPDEASVMEDRSVVMNPLYRLAREARIWIWPSFQSFASWDESTVAEMQNNARNFVAFSVPDPDTAMAISQTLPSIFALSSMSDEQTRQQAFQEQTVGISGDTRIQVVTDAHLRPDIDLNNIPRYHAYIWFRDADDVTRSRWWGRRRVRRDQNSGDAPFVKLVPYDLVQDAQDLAASDAGGSPSTAPAHPRIHRRDSHSEGSTAVPIPLGQTTPSGEEEAPAPYEVLESRTRSPRQAVETARSAPSRREGESQDWEDDEAPVMPDFHSRSRRPSPAQVNAPEDVPVQKPHPATTAEALWEDVPRDEDAPAPEGAVPEAEDGWGDEPDGFADDGVAVAPKVVPAHPTPVVEEDPFVVEEDPFVEDGLTHEADSNVTPGVSEAPTADVQAKGRAMAEGSDSSTDSPEVADRADVGDEGDVRGKRKPDKGPDNPWLLN